MSRNKLSDACAAIKGKGTVQGGTKIQGDVRGLINGLRFYSEMLFWHKGIAYEVYDSDKGIVISSAESEQIFRADEFHDKANIDGRLLKEIWDEVVHPCFMLCGDEHDYDFPPED